MYDEHDLGMYWIENPMLKLRESNGNAFFEFSGVATKFSLGGTETRDVEPPLAMEGRMYCNTDKATNFQLKTLDGIGWNGDVSDPKFTGEAATGQWAELYVDTYNNASTRKWRLHRTGDAEEASAKNIARLRSLVENRKRKVAQPSEPSSPAPTTSGTPA